MDFSGLTIQENNNDEMIVYVSHSYKKETINGVKYINGVFEILDLIGEGSFWTVYKVKRHFQEGEIIDENIYVIKEGKLSLKTNSFYQDPLSYGGHSNSSGSNSNNINYNVSDGNLNTNTGVGCSSLDNNNYEQEDASEIAIKEYEIMKQLNHPNVARLYECIFDYSKDKACFVMEFCEFGTLMDYDKETRKFKRNENIFKHYNDNIVFQIPNEEDEIYYEDDAFYSLIDIGIKIFKEIAEGFLYLHSLNICHRDLKPDNILLSERGAKIIDFSHAKQCEQGAVIETYLGNVFSPPEIRKYQPYDPFKADVWSFAFCFYVFLFNFNEKNLISFEKIDKLPSENLKKLFKLCFNENFSERPTFEQIILEDLL